MPIIPPIWRARPTTPEQALAAAILAQAFTDMFGGAATSNENRDTVDTNAVSAMRYLTARNGLSAQWRNRWCDCLDLEGDVLADRVRMILEGKIDPPGDDRFASRLAVARARWESIVQRPAPSDKPKPLPTIKPAPPTTIDPADIDLTIPDDPFYVSGSGHLRASRRWKAGEVSRFIGPLPPPTSKTGEALWAVTQATRAGRNAMGHLGDPDQVITDLGAALPNGEIGWTSQGKRLPEYQPNAGCRIYLKQMAQAA